MRATIAAVDFGTSKIVTLVAESNGGSQRCDIVGAGSAAYDGYMDGDWLDAEQLNAAIQASLSEAEKQSRFRIRNVNVGVPGEFSHIYLVEAKVDIQGTDPQVTPQHVDKVFKQAVEKLGAPTGVVVHRSPAWFMVDDGKKVLEPVGIKGRELRALVSFVVVEKRFMEDVLRRFNEMGIIVDAFFSTPVGEAMLYLEEEDRAHTAVLIDIGYLNTDVMVVEGDAIVYLKTLPVGGGHISADVAEGLHIPLDSAEQLKRAYVYGISAIKQSYEATGTDGAHSLQVAQEELSRVLEPRAEEIAEMIGKELTNPEVRLTSMSNVYLTGGGMTLNRGGRDFLASKLERPVREMPKRTVKMSSPIYTSAMGLMDIIIDTIENQHQQTAGLAGGIKEFFRSLLGG